MDRCFSYPKTPRDRCDLCFNGATTFQPWIAYALDNVDIVVSMMFQWGHDFSAMDSSRAMYLECNIDDVSMGPRLFSHG